MYHCSFCGAGRAEAPVMILGRLANICVACVEFAAGVIAEMPAIERPPQPAGCRCGRPVPYRGLALINSNCPVHGDQPFANLTESTNG